jgi:hypothetical protein
VNEGGGEGFDVGFFIDGDEEVSNGRCRGHPHCELMDEDVAKSHSVVVHNDD